MENKFLNVYTGFKDEELNLNKVSIDELIDLSKIVVLDDLKGTVYYVYYKFVVDFISSFQHETFDGTITIYDMENEKDMREVYEQYCFKQE